MKKIFFVLTFLILSTFNTTYAKNVDIMFFYSETCPHCKAESKFLDTMTEKYSQINIKRYEITTSVENQELYKETLKNLGHTLRGVPTTVINNDVIIGYQSDTTTGKEIETLIKNLTGEGKSGEVTQSIINIPIINVEINMNDISLPVLSILIGVLDGFNPCAMWVLLFLISMLLGTEDKKKMWLLGTTFILTSGLIYFLFLAAWLNVFLVMGYTTVLRIMIGFAAAGIGLYYLNEYKKNNSGCEVTNTEKRQKIFSQIRTIIKENNLLISLGGIALLAIAVNLVELLCSAGLPAVYTQILTMNNLPLWQYYSYMLLYILFFMLDDIIVFVIAMVTLETTGISAKYTNLSRLVGGIVMILIGILMLFKPELLTLRF